MDEFSFQLLAREGSARAGRITTAHGPIETPAFVPVATNGTVRSLPAQVLSSLGTQLLITNAYHLHLQPGEAVIEAMGGLHPFMGWSGPIMIDSGGFQVLSLGLAREKGGGKIASPFLTNPDFRSLNPNQKKKSLTRVTDQGIEFISYRDGSRHFFTPENVIQTGRILGADIIMVLDECTSPFQSFQETRAAMNRTHDWAHKALSAFHTSKGNGQALFGIVQGGAYQDLREQSARFMGPLPFEGYAIGGFLGNSREEMIRILDWTLPQLPPEKPRHFLGIGLVEDIFEMVGRGIDLFDCVAPTRLAGSGTFFTQKKKRFRLRILNEIYKKDPRPVEDGCGCYTCLHHSRAYLRHLFAAKEPLGFHLAALHNIHFIESLMRKIRQAIRQGTLDTLKMEWIKPA